MRYYTQGAAEEIEITRDSSDDVPIDIVTDDNFSLTQPNTQNFFYLPHLFLFGPSLSD